MPQLQKGDLVIETKIPTEITRLKSQGFAEVKQEKGAELLAAPVVTNETGRAEVVKPAPKSTK